MKERRCEKKTDEDDGDEGEVVSQVREGKDRKRNKRRRNFEGDAGNEMMMCFLGNLRKLYFQESIHKKRYH